VLQKVFILRLNLMILKQKGRSDLVKSFNKENRIFKKVADTA